MSLIKKNSVIATSGKNKIKFDIIQQGFAWIADNKIEKMIKIMKKGLRIMITRCNQRFTNYRPLFTLRLHKHNTAKKACS